MGDRVVVVLRFGLTVVLRVVVVTWFLTVPWLAVLLRVVVTVLAFSLAFVRVLISPEFAVVPEVVRVRSVAETVVLVFAEPSRPVRVLAVVPVDLSALGSVLLTP
jgi:hypothetical protein